MQTAPRIEKGAIATPEKNKNVVRRFYEALSTGDASGPNESVAIDYLNHNAIPGQKPGLEGFKETIASIRRAFPDLRFTIDDQVAEGDRVATRYTVYGTHRGEFMGVAATGKPVSWTALVLQRIADDKIQESWLQWDQLGLLQQLGEVTLPGQP